MNRRLTPKSTLENLKREAKRWLKALHANDPEAHARLLRANPDAPTQPTLRDVQHALAREHRLSGWTTLKRELEKLSALQPGASSDDALTALLEGAGRGKAARVEELLSARPDLVNRRGALGDSGLRTALHFGSGHEAVVRTLLERGADPNIRDEGDDAMPLHFAAERGDLAVVKLLIEHGADPVGDGTVHELNVLGWATCFEYAYHAEVAEYLLAHGAKHTIHTAVAMGDVKAIREIAARAPGDLDKPMDGTNHRRRPLHLAAIKKRPESLATLLALGADTEAEDAAGLTPLDQAALSGERDMAQRLLAHGARVRLPAAVALERHDDLQRLLRADPHCLRPGGRWDKLILRASESASGAVIETLIRAGASVHVRDNPRTAIDQTHGFTPLHAAASAPNADAARMLLKYGANPADREDKYWGTPAGWAAYFGRTDVRDVILEGAIDIFDAISFRNDRIAEILARDPQALDRPFGEYVTGDAKSKPWLDGAWTPVAYAVANGKLEAVRILVDNGADLSQRDSAGRGLIEIATEKGHPQIASFLEARGANAPPRAKVAASFDERLAEFLRMACLDWRSGGSERVFRMHDAGRLLEREPAIARANIYAAAACGELDEVGRILDERPETASAIGGPRSWPPLLYLCSARLPQPKSSENALAIALLLLDSGADPNAFYLGGNADIHYTALTCVLGRGEELASMHPRARELAGVLLERGADPHDNQVLYNVFADNTSRHLLDENIIWLLELMYEHSIRRGHKADWDNPLWPMFDMRGAPSLGHEERRHHGARFMLDAAVDRNLLKLAEWMLEHGAGPNAPFGKLWNRPKRTLYQEAVARGHTEMAQLLVRYGATPTPLPLDDIDAFIDACLRLDRRRAMELLAQHAEYRTDHRPMFAAVERDRVDVVELLLDLGVSPNVADAKGGGGRALHVAAAKSAEGSAALLVERGADVDARDTNYDSPPLGWASWFQQTRMVELLGRHSRDIWFLVHTGRVERVRELLREDPAKALVTSKDGDTPLMWLPDDARSALEIAALLVRLGADPGRRNARGLTAADVAVRRGLDEVATFLRGSR